MSDRPNAASILFQAHRGREVIQDFCRFQDSIEWELGQNYLRSRGGGAFLTDDAPVPFAVNNDGNFSALAANLLFESLLDQDSESGPIVVLEIGVGLGLFARFSLDHFAQRCRREDKNYYGRLLYILGDYSEKMLLDVARSGVLANHLGRYRLRVVSALAPADALQEGDVKEAVSTAVTDAALTTRLQQGSVYQIHTVEWQTVTPLSGRGVLDVTRLAIRVGRPLRG